MFVQAGAFGDQANAERLAAKMASFGDAKVYPTTINGKSFYRVRLGPYNAVPAADAVLNKILLSGTNNAMIVVD